MRKIAVVTTSRAEYGLLYWTIKRIREDRALALQLVAAGMHLSPHYGRTAEAIEFPIAAEVPMLEDATSDAATARAIGRGTLGFAKAFGRLKPDVAVILGDRFELLAAASAAVALRIPLAHIHGGESSEGVIDEQIRHALTKLSYLHFTAAEPYRRRVIQMGEDPKRVFLCGAPGLEALERLKPLSRATLEKRLAFSLDGPLVLATYHPVPGANGEADAVLRALEASGARAVLTYANADAGGRAINAKLERLARRHPQRFRAVASLGQESYLSLLRLCDAVFGNSSSGILEAPAAKVPTVNVGSRQAGRLRAPSVLDCEGNTAAMLKALKTALSPRFRSRCHGENPYVGGRVSEKIVRVLKTADLSDPRKRFHELAWSHA